MGTNLKIGLFVIIVILVLVGSWFILNNSQESKDFPSGTIYCEKDQDCGCHCCQADDIERPTCGLYSKIEGSRPDFSCAFDYCPSNSEMYDYIKCIDNSCRWIKYRE